MIRNLKLGASTSQARWCREHLVAILMIAQMEHKKRSDASSSETSKMNPHSFKSHSSGVLHAVVAVVVVFVWVVVVSVSIVVVAVLC